MPHTAETNRHLDRLVTAVDTMRTRCLTTVPDWAATLHDAETFPAETIEKLVWQAESIVERTA